MFLIISDKGITKYRNRVYCLIDFRNRNLPEIMTLWFTHSTKRSTKYYGSYHGCEWPQGFAGSGGIVTTGLKLKLW